MARARGGGGENGQDAAGEDEIAAAGGADDLIERSGVVANENLPTSPLAAAARAPTGSSKGSRRISRTLKIGESQFGAERRCEIV